MKRILLSWLNRMSGVKDVAAWVWGLIALILLGMMALLARVLEPPAQEDFPGISIGTALDVFLKLGLVILLIYVSLHILRRWQTRISGNPTQQMTIVETLHLSPRQALHLVQAGSQVLLIGATDQTLTCLTEVELLTNDE